MINKVLLGVLVLALGALWWQAGRVGDLTEDNARLGRSVSTLEEKQAQTTAAYVEAEAVAARSRARTAQIRERIDKINKTKFGGCSEEIIDPNLLDAINGVRGPR